LEKPTVVSALGETEDLATVAKIRVFFVFVAHFIPLAMAEPMRFRASAWQEEQSGEVGHSTFRRAFHSFRLAFGG
jgi:hypothetical protein